MYLSFAFSVRAATLSLVLLSWITALKAAPVMNKTEFIDWFDNVTADSPFMKGESIAKHLFARAEMDRPLTVPVDIGPPDSVTGGCSSIQEAGLNNAWFTAYILLTYAQAALANYGTDDVSRFIFARLYGIIWGQEQIDGTWPALNADMQGDLDHLDAVVEEVLDFMEGKGLPTNIAGRSLFPGPDQSFMYCSTQWKVFHNWDDPAFNSNGQVMHDSNGDPISIGQLDSLKPWKDNLYTNTLGETYQLYPYWVATRQTYSLDRLHPGTPPSFCNAPNALGESSDRSLPFALTICPQTFQLNPATITTGTPLGNLYPPGGVMLHELIHFTQGGLNTPDTCYGAVGCMGLITREGTNTGRKKALTNPDTLVLMATAYMYSVMDSDGTSGDGNSHLYYDLSQGNARAFRVDIAIAAATATGQ